MTNPAEAAAAFIAKWSPSGGAELANSQSFLRDLCDLLDVPHPDPKVASDHADDNAYVFEKDVLFKHGDGTTSNGRIDLYKRGCFVLESKQGSANPADLAAPSVPLAAPVRQKRGTAVRGTPAWSQAMDRAYGQAAQYARALPEWPAFLAVVDVGHAFAVYANFARDGKAYLPFPDPQNHRFLLDDLTDDAIRDRLRRMWLDPLSLDPSRHAAKVTTAVAERLAALATSLEKQKHGAEPVADFLMRCLFTMFAEDVGLLPADSFTGLLTEMRTNPAGLASMLEALWREMDCGGFSTALRSTVLRFNGRFFHDATALPLDTAQIDHLIKAAKSDWSQVEPAIFGTLLERALDPKERHSLGAHFTPRAYVERLVFPTVIEPLRDDWQNVKAAAATLMAKQSANDKQLAAWRKEAIELVSDYRRKLCQIRVLDPACGTGNFLYITLEHMKRLEGEVIETLADMGEAQEALDLAGATVDPHQFLGIELNPRAVPIAELVLWIGYLQWHYRQHGKVAPAEPVLRDFRNIEHRDAVLAYDRIELVLDEHGAPVTRWDGETMKKHPVTGKDVPDESARAGLTRIVNPRKAEWPEADFVVSNPPFLGSKRMRSALGDEYVDALQQAWPEVPQATDYVMRWWSHAADLARDGRIRQFGLITTNSITGKYVRRAVEGHLTGPNPMSIIFAVPNHPWVDTQSHAAVRISMTVGCAGRQPGVVLTVTAEHRKRAEKGQDLVAATSARTGFINSNLTVGPDVTACRAVTSNQGLCSVGMKTIGDAFQVDEQLARALGLGVTPSLENHIRPYVSGRDLAQSSRGKFVIDFYGLDESELMARFPQCYQYLLTHAKPARDQNRNALFRRDWWVIGHPRQQFRAATLGTPRFVATPETAKHLWFVFVPIDLVPDSTLVTFALPDALFLGVMSSRVHVLWALEAGGRLGVGDDPRYNKSACFDAFPFPAPTDAQAARIRELAESLDAHRKSRQAEHADLTMTNMYNVLENLRARTALSAKDKKTHEQGLCSTLLKLHDDLDEAVFAAYGWPTTLTDEELLERLVALNAERAEEESRGLIRYLRPDYQAPTEPTQLAMDTEDEDQPEIPAAPKPQTDRPEWPPGLVARIALVQSALKTTPTPTTPESLARTFKNAKTDQVAEILETLKTLGLLRRLESGSYAP
jgi:hypothetical protein